MSNDSKHTPGPRRFACGKFGLKEDPIRRHIAWTVGELHYIATVVGVRRDSVTGAVLLQTRHLNGEEAPEVVANLVEVLG